MGENSARLQPGLYQVVWRLTPNLSLSRCVDLRPTRAGAQRRMATLQKRWPDREFWIDWRPLLP